MGDKGNSNGGLRAFFQRIWAGVVGIFGVVSAILGYVKLAEGNLGLFTLVLLGVGVASSFLSCFYYAFVWKPETTDGQLAASLIITPGSNRPVVSQGKKEKQRKRVRWIARFGLLLVPLLVWGGYRFYQYQVDLPPTDFKILVANFEGSDAENHRVTQEIFRNLEREMEAYGDEVKVERLNKSLRSIKEAKKAGKSHKAAIVIWGDYQIMEDIVPISVNFEILKETTDYFELGETVQGKTQPAQLSELTSFQLQTSLSQEMTYLSLFTLGMYRDLDDDWEEATQFYQRALAVSTQTNIPISSLGKEVIYFYLGTSSYLLELHDKAIKFYDQAIEINPDLYKVWTNRGASLADLGKYKEAIASYDKAVEINPNYYAAWNNRGNALASLGKYKEALSSSDKAVEIKPDDDTAWNNRGASLADLGKYKEAITSYDRAIAINPDNDNAWNNRGNALANLGKYEEAIASYAQAIAINPDYYSAWYRRGASLANLGRYEEAIVSYDKAIAIKPDNDNAWNNHGVALDELGKYEEAIYSYDKAIIINPDNDNAWYNRGTALGKLDKYEEAIASYDKAIAINPDDDAWFNRGNALGNLGKHETAIASYDKAIVINPKYDAAWNNRGVDLSNLGKYEEAISSFDKAIIINPDLYQAWYNKAASYASQNDIDSALKNLKQAFSLNPQLREYIKTDPAFDAIRNEQRFEDLIENN
ncbi:MAG: tetratricopeptide repeat protein [Cyanobacteria bacterium P01_G01_bin.39]